MITRSEVRTNRQAWIDYLLTRGPEHKFRHVLENVRNPDQRCCLGHACHVLGLSRRVEDDNGNDMVIYGESKVFSMPADGVHLLGLWDDAGSAPTYLMGIALDALNGLTTLNSLAAVNDDTEATPAEIGAYLANVIEGGDTTPFKLLEDYPE